MTMQLVSVSSKGQIAIPVSYRKALSINEGSQLVIYSDGENIILKPIELPSEDKLSAPRIDKADTLAGLLNFISVSCLISS